jgi:hypothetical protein
MHFADFVPILTALIYILPGLIVGLHNKRAIQDVHLVLNSRLDQLVSASEDKGRIAERSDIASGIQTSPPSTEVPK